MRNKSQFVHLCLRQHNSIKGIIMRRCIISSCQHFQSIDVAVINRKHLKPWLYTFFRKSPSADQHFIRVRHMLDFNFPVIFVNIVIRRIQSFRLPQSQFFLRLFWQNAWLPMVCYWAVQISAWSLPIPSSFPPAFPLSSPLPASIIQTWKSPLSTILL